MPQSSSALMVFLITDLVDWTAWKKILGDRAYADELRLPHDRLFRDLLASMPGALERDNAGDGFFATFPSPGDAVVFALKFHHVLAQHPWGETIAMSGKRPITRIGIYLGEVVEFDDRSFDALNRAATFLDAKNHTVALFPADHASANEFLNQWHRLRFGIDAFEPAKTLNRARRCGGIQGNRHG